MDEEPLVSIIIPTFNSERTLEPTLQSIKSQTYDRIEVIVVDKGSRDKTVDVALSHNAMTFVVNGEERCVAFNYGASKAKGKYIYEVGSDYVLEPTVVAEAVVACEDGGFDAVCIHNTSDPSISFWSKVRKFERDMYRDDDLNVAARFVRRDVFLRIGGFREELVAAEDYDLHNRIIEGNFRIGRIRAQEVHIGEPRTIADVIRRFYYYGKTIGLFVNSNRNKALRQLSPLRPAFVRHRKEFRKHPTLAIGFVVYQFVRYFSALAGFVLRRIDK
jgi:glycosyltransferase involved in cell wall biosynthesis